MYFNQEWVPAYGATQPWHYGPYSRHTYYCVKIGSNSFTENVGSIPAQLQSGGALNLSGFEQYVIEGLSAIIGQNVALSGGNLRINGSGFGEIAAHSLIKTVMDLGSHILISLTPFALSDNTLAYQEDGTTVYRNPVDADLGRAEEVFDEGDTTNIVPTESVIQRTPALEGALSQYVSSKRFSLNQRDMFDSILRASLFNNVRLSSLNFSTNQNISLMVQLFLKNALELAQKAGGKLYLQDLDHKRMLALTNGRTDDSLLMQESCGIGLYFIAHEQQKPSGDNEIVHHPFVLIPKQYMFEQGTKALIEAQENINIKMKGRIDADSAQFKAKQALLDGKEGIKLLASKIFAERVIIRSEGEIELGAAHRVYEHKVDGSTHKEHDVVNLSEVCEIVAKNLMLVSLSGGDIVLEGTKIKVDQSKAIFEKGGKLHFKLAEHNFYSYRFDDDSNWAWNDVTQSVKQDKTFTAPLIAGTFDVIGAERVFLERVKDKSKASNNRGFYTNAMLAFMELYDVSSDKSFETDYWNHLTTENSDILEYKLAQEIHKYSYDNQQGFSALFSGLMACVVGICTGGLGLGVSAVQGATATVLGGTGITLTGASAVAANAAMASLYMTTTQNMLVNITDPAKGLKETLSSKTLKNMGKAALCAGIANAVTNALDISPDALKADMVDPNMAESIAIHAPEGVTRGIVNATVSATFDKDYKGDSLLEGVAADAVGAGVANSIGDAAFFGKMDDIQQTLAHGALGAAVGGILEGEKGITAGALSAMIAENVSKYAYKSGDSIQDAAKIGKIVGITLATLSTGNLNASQFAANNAVDHNFIKHFFKIGPVFKILRKYIKSQKATKELAKKGVEKAANSNIAGPKTVEGQALRSALREVEKETGRKITTEQKKRLIDYCLKNESKFEKLSPSDKLSHSKPFQNRSFKDKLIEEWECMGGQTKVREWPKYPVKSPDGKPIIDPKTGLQKMNDYQAHHIIPQQVEGPHAWWNMHPAHPNVHQSVLHGSGSKLLEILKTLS